MAFSAAMTIISAMFPDPLSVPVSPVWQLRRLGERTSDVTPLR
jgi:hypothetical protein